MHLCNIGLINWHLFPLMDIPVHGQIIGIVGENKSGKSTVLDAVQTVLTGCDQSAMGFNRVAAEKGGRGASRRTAHSYCLGRLGEDDNTIRQEAITYLLLSFEDPHGVKKPVTIGIALEARRSESTVHVASRFIVKGAILQTSDFAIALSNGDREVHPWTETRLRIRQIVADRGATIEEYRDTAKEFVKEYMHAMFYRNRTASQSQYIKNLINAITFRDMNSANEFVRKFLLPEDPVPVSGLRSSIKLYRDASAAVDEMKSKLVSLKKLKSLLDDLERVEQEARLNQWIASRAKAASAIALLRKNRNQLAAKTDAHAKKSAQIADIDERVRDVDYEIQKLSDERRNRLSEDRAVVIRGQIAILTAERRRIVEPIYGRAGAAQAVRQLYIHKGSLARQFPEIAEALEDAHRLVTGQIGLDADLPREPVVLDALLTAIKTKLDEALPVINQRKNVIMRAVSEISAEREDLVKRINAARDGKISLSSNVEAMVKRLREEGIPSQVVCELVEVGSPDWADAAEAFLGRNRETIIVSVEDNERATDILSRERSKFRGVTVANSRKLASMPTDAPAGSLASVLKSSNPIAKAFIVFKTGGINLAQSRQDLDKRGRWLMRDGTYDDGVQISVIEPVGGHRLGLRAQQGAVDGYKTKIAELDERLAKLTPDVSILDKIDYSIKAFSSAFEEFHKDDNGSPIPFSKATSEVLPIETERAALLKNLATLNDVDVSVLDGEIHDLEEEKSKATETKEGYRNERADLASEIKSITGSIGSGESYSGSLLHARFMLGEHQKTRRKLGVDQGLASYVARRRNFSSPGLMAQDAEKRSQDAQVETTELKQESRVEAHSCLALMNATDLFDTGSGILDAVKPWASEQIEEIEDETLVQFEYELKEAQRQTDDMFRNSFVNELAGRFMKVKTELEDIRDVLKRYPFLGEKYTFRSTPTPGYEAFHRIVERQREVEQSSMPLFKGEVEGDSGLADDLRTVQAVLLSEDIDLEKYEDYRLYFAFEIEITDIASGRVVPWSHRRGTASGGETQTPYYVALLSALSSIYYGGARSRLKEDEGGLCLAVFDEAFSKMDEKVRYLMVDFCSELGLQLLLCGPDGGRQSMERYANTLVDVWRSGDQSFASPDIIKQRTRDELAAMDPSLMTRETVEQAMVAR